MQHILPLFPRKAVWVKKGRASVVNAGFVAVISLEDNLLVGSLCHDRHNVFVAFLRSAWRLLPGRALGIFPVSGNETTEFFALMETVGRQINREQQRATKYPGLDALKQIELYILCILVGVLFAVRGFWKIGNISFDNFSTISEERKTIVPRQLHFSRGKVQVSRFHWNFLRIAVCHCWNLGIQTTLERFSSGGLPGH